MTNPLDIFTPFRGPFSDHSLEPIFRTIPACLYLLAIRLVSSVEGKDLPVLVDDRIAHFLEYFILGVLLYFAASGFDRKARRWTVALSVVLFAAAYCAFDELHQSIVPGRVASAGDLGFDVFGATTSAILIRWLAWRKESR